jgi:hypothetical protein
MALLVAWTLTAFLLVATVAHGDRLDY